MKFYEFVQNNSGGTFEVNKTLCHKLYIEAVNEIEANEIAENLGVYFNGVELGIDCSCCGDSWTECWEGDYISIERYSTEGYLVSVSDFYDNAEEEWYKNYGKYEIIEEPVWTEVKYSSTKYFSGKIKFNTIEDYVEFKVKENGKSFPIARIFYKDGKVLEFDYNQL